jgi:hypothetical protein
VAIIRLLEESSLPFYHPHVLAICVLRGVLVHQWNLKYRILLLRLLILTKASRISLRLHDEGVATARLCYIVYGIISIECLN